MIRVYSGRQSTDMTKPKGRIMEEIINVKLKHGIHKEPGDMVFQNEVDTRHHAVIWGESKLRSFWRWRHKLKYFSLR